MAKHLFYKIDFICPQNLNNSLYYNKEQNQQKTAIGMVSKYPEYTIEELFEDKSFISWALHNKNKSTWENLFEKHPEFRKKAYKAREIIQLLEDSYELLDEESVVEMWQNINRFELSYKQKIKKIKQRRLIGWAATILIIVTTGMTFYFNHNSNRSSYVFVSESVVGQSDNARLILSGGNEIILQKDNSFITIDQDSKLIIDSDSIISLANAETEPMHNVEMNEVIIPFGKRSELLLVDGTKVWLNAGSRFAFPTHFVSDKREVFLEGEACFRVAENKNKPFVVKAGELDITVLGTYFDVSAYPSDNSIQTVLVEGSVAVKKNTLLGLSKSEIVMHPYQKVNFDKQLNEMNVFEVPDAKVYMAWTEGWLQFSKESLFSVLNKLERYYNIKIKITKSFSSHELITGKLDLKESLEEVMMALADVAQIDYIINEKVIYIENKMKE